MTVVARFFLLCTVWLVLPSITAPAQSQSSFSYEVTSTRGWQTASILVHQGQALSFSAEGAWSVDYRNFQNVGPEGYPPEVDGAIQQGCKLDPSQPYGLLLVRIGDDPNLQLLGRGGQLVASSDGPVSFRIHDNDACLGDNAGSVKVTVTSEQFSTAVQAPPPFYVCLSGPGSTCEGLYSNPVRDPGSSSLPPWFTSPEAGKCLLTIGDKITKQLDLQLDFALPELQYLTTLYTDAAAAGLPLTRR